MGTIWKNKKVNLQVLVSNNELKKEREKEDIMMKSVISGFVLVIIIVTFCIADDFIYDSPYGGKTVGKIDDDGFIYDSPYGGKKIGRVEDGVVYDRSYGGSRVGRIEEDGRLYDKPYGGSAVGRHEDGKVYDKPYGGSAIGRTENREGSGY
jgi:hypothetical protein